MYNMFMKTGITTALLVGLAGLTWYGYSAHVTFTVQSRDTLPAQISESAPTATAATTSSSIQHSPTSPIDTLATASIASGALSHDDLLALADDKYADGNVSLGDNKYVTSGPKKGYVYLCNIHKDNPGSMANGPWMHGTSWNYMDKISVEGSVAWPNATFSNKVSGSSRTISGNGLPVGHTTGVFPVSASDDASKYDKNPNTISTQTLSKKLPSEPKYSQVPNCMGGEVGIMLTGIPLFNAFDAGLRDAAAHELQDSCDGHPQGSGEYHYHSMSACFKDISVSTVLGYALDGFPITGPKVADKKYLTTEDLDECHGLTSEVTTDGKKKMMYHYVMTRDFPYSASCFRGKPASLMVIQGASGPPRQGVVGGQANLQTQQNAMQGSPAGESGAPPAPPQEAVTACKSMNQGDSCSFSTSDGMQITGHCDTPPGQSLACVPR